MSLANLQEGHALHDTRRGIRKMPLPPYLVFYTCDKAAGVVNILQFWPRRAALAGVSAMTARETRALESLS